MWLMAEREMVKPMPESGIRAPQADLQRASELCKSMESALRSGRWREAAELGERVLACAPHHLWAECLLGQAYLAQGSTSQARACFRSILERDPECSVAHLGLAVQPEPAEVDDDRNVTGGRARPDISTSHRSHHGGLRLEDLPARSGQRALALWRSGSLGEAAAEARSLVRVAPKDLKATLLLTDIAWQNGDPAEFAGWFHKAQRLDPSGVVARRVWGEEHPLLHALNYDPPVWTEGTRTRRGSGYGCDGRLQECAPQDSASMLGGSIAAPEDPPWLLNSHLLSTPVSSHSPFDPAQVGQHLVESSSEPAMSQVETDQELAEIKLELERIASSLRLDGVSSLLSSWTPAPVASKPVAPSAGAGPSGARARSTPRLEAPWEFIVSNRTALEAKYGRTGASRIQRALTKLAEATTAEGRVCASVLYLDDPQALEPYGLSPTDPRDPQELRYALGRLEECIRDGEGVEADRAAAYFLLVGGDDIVPFHPLPDPSDDEDEFLLSDHPYAYSGSDHLSFERALGRIPDGASRNPAFLLRLITAATEAHQPPQEGSPGRWDSIWQAFGRWIGRTGSERPLTSFGYSASIWRHAAREVFSTIGQASDLRTSPPLTSDDMPPLGPIAPRFSYFNLHGMRDSAYWYGQRDPTYAASYPLFPVAIAPDNIPVAPHPEGVVFSEACYGAYVLNKDQMSSLALRFLAAQALGVVGSTALAYGAIDTPLMGADLLAKAFWERVKAGCPQGEALRLAKRALIQEMLARQGYLDPEDEKTILSFVLYGDPTLVIRPLGVDAIARMLPEASRESAWLKAQRASGPQTISAHHFTSLPTGDGRDPYTLCRRPLTGPDLVPPELMSRVQHQVSSYLPSSLWNDVTVCAQTVCNGGRCHGECSMHRSAASGRSRATVPQAHVPKGGDEHVPSQGEFVFTLQQKSPGLKGSADNSAMHQQIVKVTVDNRGDLLKIAVSR